MQYLTGKINSKISISSCPLLNSANIFLDVFSMNCDKQFKFHVSKDYKDIEDTQIPTGKIQMGF